MNTASPWVHNGRMDIDIVSITPTIGGQPLVVGNGFDNGLDALIDVEGTGGARIFPNVDFRSDAEVQIAPDSGLTFHGIVTAETGAEFSGGGSLLINSQLTVEDNLLMDLELVNSGELVIVQGSFGDLTVRDYLQTAFGELELDLRNAQLDIFDHLIATGDVELDGTLDTN